MSQTLPVTIVIHPELCDDERLAELLDKLQDLGPVLEQIGGALEASNRANFESQGYGEWANLTDRTWRERFRLGYGPMQMLVRTGALKAAVEERGAPGHKFLVSANSVAVGVYGDVIPYAEYLAQGTSRMPARILINLTADTIQTVIDIITNWLGGPNGVDVTADAPITTNSGPWAVAA